MVSFLLKSSFFRWPISPLPEKPQKRSKVAKASLQRFTSKLLPRSFTVLYYFLCVKNSYKKISPQWTFERPLHKTASKILTIRLSETKKPLRYRYRAFSQRFKIGCGDRIRTCDLWVMSPTSYRAAPPRDKKLFSSARTPSNLRFQRRIVNEKINTFIPYLVSCVLLKK